MNLSQKNIEDFLKTLVRIIENKYNVEIEYEIKDKKKTDMINKSVKNNQIFIKKSK